VSLSQFHEVSLPMRLSHGASGGPERRVEVIPLSGGREARNAVWAGSRRRWDVGSSAVRPETLAGLVAFFEARGGRLHGFRFRDPLDERSSEQGTEVSRFDQVLATADGTQTAFDLVKHYGDFTRRIWKPVAGTVRAGINGVEAEAETDAVNGRITFAAPPSAGTIITAGYVFDCPVRFDTDRLDVNLEDFGAGRVLRVPLIELIG
jgi:uncharacterized protein (TIGR02217 family)